MTLRFKTKTGRLTLYSFACGYVEKKTLESVQVTLWQEHSLFHVRAHDLTQGKRLFWESFTKLSDARDLYDNVTDVIKEATL